jgi:hypothetical protein
VLSSASVHLYARPSNRPHTSCSVRMWRFGALCRFGIPLRLTCCLSRCTIGLQCQGSGLNRCSLRHILNCRVEAIQTRNPALRCKSKRSSDGNADWGGSQRPPRLVSKKSTFKGVCWRADTSKRPWQVTVVLPAESHRCVCGDCPYHACTAWHTVVHLCCHTVTERVTR